MHRRQGLPRSGCPIRKAVPTNGMPEPPPVMSPTMAVFFRLFIMLTKLFAALKVLLLVSTTTGFSHLTCPVAGSMV